MSSNETNQIPIAAAERADLDKKVLVWLNTYPDSPVDTIKTEPQLPVNTVGMALSGITSAYYSKRYILGGYLAEYSFKIIYRIKPGTSVYERMAALELLNEMGAWCTANNPDLGDPIHVLEVAPTSPAEFYAAYEGGDEDYFISMKLIYEVI